MCCPLQLGPEGSAAAAPAAAGVPTAARDPDHHANTERGTLSTSLVAAGSVEYTVVLPPNHSKDRAEPYPLILYMHPGGATQEHLLDPQGTARTGRDVFAKRDVVWAAFGCGTGGMFMNKYDGTDKWEDFAIQEFLPFIEGRYGCGGHQSRRYMTGICMGGLGTLKISLKHPRLFAAVAAAQPAMFHAADAKDVLATDGMVALMGLSDGVGNIAMYGAEDIVHADPAFFRKYVSPIANCIDNAGEIRASGMKIYLDVGDEDAIHLQDAAELLHRAMWQHRIRHEYHLVHGADHVGASWARRGPVLMDFLFRAMDAAISPVGDVLTKEERAWVSWVAGGRQGEEPPKPSDEIMGAGTFSDKNAEVMKANLATVSEKVGGHTDGPEELMGHPWRAAV